MNSFPPFIYKKEKSVIPLQIRLELEVPVYNEEKEDVNEDDANRGSIIIDIL